MKDREKTTGLLVQLVEINMKNRPGLELRGFFFVFICVPFSIKKK